MPELPDVEFVVRMLRRRTVGRRIARVTVLDRSVVRSPTPALFARRLRGRVVQRVHRRGKYLLVALSGGTTVVGHLRMTGEFVVLPRREPPRRHTRLVIGLDDRDIRFIDQRRFGHVDLVATGAVDDVKGLRGLGLEPLSPAFTLEQFRDLVRARRGALKGFLLRQDVIAGIGNLYADEILYHARLHPAQQTHALRPQEVRRLYHAIRTVLTRAIRALSRRDGPVGELLRVRTRDGVCPRSRHRLRTATISGRTAYFCPHCQRAHA